MPEQLMEMLSAMPVMVIFSPDDDGKGYWVESPDLLGCFAAGADIKEASKNFKDAVFEYFDVPRELHKRGLLQYGMNDLESLMESPKPTTITLERAPQVGAAALV
ncbi:type II toxin-antitoxin system HicB family antitoxin [Patescibacteria group bacterium]|nr:type II toxin-antitoxin system HicB family antitoxin [Patescibacteria group bacterium]